MDDRKMPAVINDSSGSTRLFDNQKAFYQYNVDLRRKIINRWGKH